MSKETVEAASVLLAAVKDLTAAINHLADVTGGTADKGIEVTITEQPEPELTYTFDNVKSALNAYNKANGKEKTFKIIKYYSDQESTDPRNIDKKDYAKIMEELTNGA